MAYEIDDLARDVDSGAAPRARHGHPVAMTASLRMAAAAIR
jgi:hypothetical protein